MLFHLFHSLLQKPLLLKLLSSPELLTHAAEQQLALLEQVEIDKRQLEGLVVLCHLYTIDMLLTIFTQLCFKLVGLIQQLPIVVKPTCGNKIFCLG